MPSTGRPLSLARALSRDVPDQTRAKGATYFRSGAVVSIVGFDDKVIAVVQGTRDYHVEITREMEGFIGSCDCPYFQDRFHVCKHIWAAILAADSRGLLPPADSQSWIEPVDVPAERDDVVTGDSATSAGGITRDTIITLARDLAFKVVETDMPREFLYPGR